MSIMVQIRNMPSPLHRELKARAAKAGLSLSDYLLRELEDVAARPTMEEWAERLKSRSRVETSLTPAEVVREERDSH